MEEVSRCLAALRSFVGVRGVADMPVIAISRCQAVETAPGTLCEKCMTDAVAAPLPAVVFTLAEGRTHENVILGVVWLMYRFITDELVTHDFSPIACFDGYPVGY